MENTDKEHLKWKRTGPIDNSGKPHLVLLYEYQMHPYLVKVGLSSFTLAIVSAISASLSFSGL